MKKRKEDYGVLFARKGGIARAEKLTPEQRRSSAIKAAKARWRKDTPDAAVTGPSPLEIDDPIAPDPFDLQAIRNIPSIESFPGVLNAIDKELMVRFSNTLSDNDQRQFAKYGLAPPDRQKSREMNQSWDGFVITQARVIGYRIFLSRCCLQTILQWWQEAQNGPALLGKLGKNLDLGARILRGQACAPIESAHYPFRQDLRSEITALQKLLTSNPIIERRRAPEQLLAVIERLISLKDAPSSFRCLRQNWRSFSTFLRDRPELLSGLSNGETTSADLANQFMGYGTNRDPESLRIEVSREGSKKRAPRPPASPSPKKPNGMS